MSNGIREAVAQQCAPAECGGESVQRMVIADIEAREKFGIEKYGTALKAENGRSHLIDAYQEALDLCVYLRAEIERRKASSVKFRGWSDSITFEPSFGGCVYVEYNSNCGGTQVYGRVDGQELLASVEKAVGDSDV